jgi:hypothetical protein
MTAAAKCNRPHCGASPRVNAVRKAEAWGQGDRFLALKVVANAIAEGRDFVPRRWRPEAAAGSVEHADREGKDQPLRTMRGLGILCPRSSFTIEHGSEHRQRLDVMVTQRNVEVANGSKRPAYTCAL